MAGSGECSGDSSKGTLSGMPVGDKPKIWLRIFGGLATNDQDVVRQRTCDVDSSFESTPGCPGRGAAMLCPPPTGETILQPARRRKAIQIQIRRFSLVNEWGDVRRCTESCYNGLCTVTAHRQGQAGESGGDAAE